MTRTLRPLTRRRFLASGLAGCSLAASPLVTPIGLAQVPSESRLVVILLRGGVDGLDLVRPTGDPDFAAARPDLVEDAAGADLGGGFSLHPGLSDLLPLWRAGGFGVVHAVSTPYRDKRSHFEGQDILEAGLPALDPRHRPDSGWLNRVVARLPGATARTAFAVEREGALILQGAAPATEWYPQIVPDLTTQAQRLLGWIYEEDPLFDAAAEAAFGLIADADASDAPGDLPPDLRVPDYVARQLLADTRLATFSLNGWDTHRAQAASLRRPLARLQATLLHLHAVLAPVWDRTAILVMTEFGRTVRLNGTGGTDHGTGGALLYLGGALRGGQVAGRWPGLAEAALYDRRDLMPTADLRAYAAGVIAAQFGVSRTALAQEVFPGLDMAGAVPLSL